MNTFQLRILAADRIKYTGPCVSVCVPTEHGVFGVQAHHTNMIGAIQMGVMKYKVGEDDEFLNLVVSDGIIKVESNDVLIMVDTAESPEDIDELRAQREAEDAKEAMLQKKSQDEFYENEARLARALVRLKAKGNSQTIHF